MGAVAAIHPGRVLQCFDHFVADLRRADGANGEPPIRTAAPAGTFTDERDILCMLAAFGGASVTIDDRPAPGEPFADPWWAARLSRAFSSCHVALGEASLEPGRGWCDTLRAPDSATAAR